MGKEHTVSWSGRHPRMGLGPPRTGRGKAYQSENRLKRELHFDLNCLMKCFNHSLFVSKPAFIYPFSRQNCIYDMKKPMKRHQLRIPHDGIDLRPPWSIYPAGSMSIISSGSAHWVAFCSHSGARVRILVLVPFTKQRPNDGNQRGTFLFQSEACAMPQYINCNTLVVA